MSSRRRPSACAHPGCPELTTTSYCPEHTPAPWTGSDRRQRLPRNWDRIRARVLVRDGHRCVQCGAPANEVDHVINNDDHSMSNLQSLCGPHHREKTQAEARAARHGR